MASTPRLSSAQRISLRPTNPRYSPLRTKPRGPEDIMSVDERPVSRVRSALAVFLGTGIAERSTSPLDFPSRPRPYLLLRVFLARLSNSRTDRPARYSARRRIPPGGRRALRTRRLLVCAHAALDRKRPAHGGGNLLGGHARLRPADFERVAPRHAGNLLRVFPLLRQCGTGLFRVPIRRHAARS